MLTSLMRSCWSQERSPFSSSHVGHKKCTHIATPRQGILLPEWMIKFSKLLMPLVLPEYRKMSATQRHVDGDSSSCKRALGITIEAAVPSYRKRSDRPVPLFFLFLACWLPVLP